MRARIQQFMRANLDGFASLEEAADAVSAYREHRSRPKDVSGLKKNLRLKEDGRWYWHWDPKYIDRRAGQYTLGPNANTNGHPL